MIGRGYVGFGSRKARFSALPCVGPNRVQTIGSFLVGILFLALWSTGASAQINTATLAGTVADATGAVIPGASVTILQVANGVSRTTSTNDKGVFIEPLLLPGLYQVTVAKSGFKTAVQSVELLVDQRANLEFAMTTGSVSQSVNVTSAAPELDTQTASLGTVIGAKEIDQLPLNGRQFIELLQLAPGAAPMSVSQTAVPQIGGPSSNVVPEINGGTGRSNVFFVDGLFATDPFFSTYSISPAVDAIQEFQEQSHTDQPQFGAGIGATVNLETKGGTNQFHGSAYEFFRNESIEASPYFDCGAACDGATKGVFDQNQFGGTFGGPFLRKKLFFFGYYDGYRFKQASTIPAFLPTEAELGDFGTTDADFSALLPETVIYDPYSYNAATGTIYPFGPTDPVNPSSGANIIPKALLNQPLLAVLKSMLPSTLPTSPTEDPNFRNTESATTTQNQYSIRVDYNPDAKDALFFRWSNSVAANYSPQAIPGNGFSTGFDGRNTGGTWTHIFSRNLVAQLAIGYNSTDHPQYYGLTDSGSLYGLGQFSGYQENPGDTLVPLTPGITNTTGYFGTDSGWGPIGPQRIGQFSGFVTKQSGNHSYSFGAATYYAKMYTNWNQNYVNFSNEATWDPCATGIPGSKTSPCTPNSNTGNSLASMVLGLPQSASTELGNSGITLIAHVSDVYAQDSWRVNPKLTVNYGLRWDYTSPIQSAGNVFSGFNVNNGTWYLARGDVNTPTTYALPSIVQILDRRTITAKDYGNYGPRLGFAYHLAPTWVVSAGVGVFWDNWSGTWQAAQNARGAWPSGYSPTVPNGAINIAGVSYSGTTPLNAQNPFGPAALKFPETPVGDGGSYLNPNWKDAYSWEWNLQVQKEFGPSRVVKVSYVGSSTNRETIQTPSNVSLVLGPVYDPPYPQMDTPNIQSLNSVGHFQYNAFEAQYTQQYAKGLTMTASFTYSRNLNEGCADFWEGCNIQDPYDMSTNAGESPVSLPLVFTFSSTYELPFGKGMPYANTGAAAKVFGGWQLNGIVTSFSGEAFTTAINFDDENAGDGDVVNSERPNVSGSTSGPKTLSEYFKTSAFSVPAPYTYGNAGYDSLRGPAFNDVDCSLFRNFAFLKRYNLELRAEVFNLFNHPNFANPDGTIEDSTFGQITSTASAYNPRELQFAGHLTF